MKQIQTEVYTWKLLLKDKSTINITQKQYEAIIPNWSCKKYEPVYLKRQEEWLNTWDIVKPINIEKERRKREAAYFVEPEEKELTNKEKEELKDNLKRVRVLKKYIFGTKDDLSESEIEVVKEHYKEVAIDTKAKLEETYTVESKDDLQIILEDCRHHWNILTNK